MRAFGARAALFMAILLACFTTACGGAGGAPTISQLSLPSQPIALGTQANGTLHVSDPDGLGGLRLQLTFVGPSNTAADVAVQGASDALTAADVPFVFGLTQAASPGQYTLKVVARDGDSNASNELSGTFVAQ